MAVFPDRIILKNSTDSQAAIEAAIGSGGSDEIAYGELVVGREPGSVKLYSIDANGAVATIGNFAYGDISPYLAVPGTYTQRYSFNSIPPTGQWSASTTQLIFPATAANGLNLNAGVGSTNPGTIGISDNNVDFTYYTCTAWDAFTTYFRATLTGLNAQDFYDLGDRPIWVDFGPKANPLDGYTFVYETAINAFKIKKNSIGNQGDFDYQREVSVYEFDFSASDTPVPSAGTATKWSSRTDASLYLSTTDKNAVDAETDLYRLTVGSSVTMSVNGSIVYSGALAQTRDANSSRIELVFPSVQSWITNLQVSDVVGIKSDEVFDIQAAALSISDGQVLTWVDADSKWKPVNTAAAVGAIDDLSDVDTSTTPPTNNQALAWDSASSQWKPATFAGGVTAIDDLSDVDTTTTPPTDGQALVWDNANSQWEPGTVSGGGGGNNYYSDNLWPVDPNYANLSLGLHADGNFNDHSTNLFVPTVFGNTAINTNVSRFGSGSIEFDGSGDYVRYAFDTALDLLGGSWTIHCWVKPDLTSGRRVMGSGGGAVGWNSTNGIHWFIGVTGDGVANLQYWDGTTNQGLSGGTCPVNAWTHVAATYDGTTARLFVDGTSVGSSTTAPVRPSTDPNFDLGTIPGEAGGSSTNWDGFIDDIYIYKGVAVWTANFTPPTSPLGTTSGGGLVSLDALSDVDTVTVAPTDGQVLAWDNANSVWEPASLRALLGIGEYVDDTAAGSGGVASGALYYNTTSSDYRLKT